MAGDRFNLRATSWYRKNGATPGTPVSPLNDLISALVGGVSGVAGSKATSGELNSNSTMNSPAGTFYQSHNGVDSTTKPKAFLNWILLDEQFKIVSSNSGFEQVGSDQEFKTHLKSSLFNIRQVNNAPQKSVLLRPGFSSRDAAGREGGPLQNRQHKSTPVARPLIAAGPVAASQHRKAAFYIHHRL